METYLDVVHLDCNAASYWWKWGFSAIFWLEENVQNETIMYKDLFIIL